MDPRLDALTPYALEGMDMTTKTLTRKHLTLHTTEEKPMTRKQYNRTLTALAREAGCYPALLASWDAVAPLRDEGVPAEEALRRITGISAALTMDMPAKPAKKASRKASPKGEVTVGKIKAAIRKGYRAPLSTPDQFPCGFAWVEVEADGRTRLGKALKEAGFQRSEPGYMELWVHVEGTQGVDIRRERAQHIVDGMVALGVPAWVSSRLD